MENFPSASWFAKVSLTAYGGELNGEKEGNVLELLQVLNEGNWVLKASRMGVGRMLCPWDSEEGSSCFLGWEQPREGEPFLVSTTVTSSVAAAAAFAAPFSA